MIDNNVFFNFFIIKEKYVCVEFGSVMDLWL